jgi:hypothetical protein
VIGLSRWLVRVSTGWVSLAAALVFVLFVALVLPAQVPVTGPGGAEVGSPDLSFWYTPDELYEIAEDYGEQGREQYIRARVTFDVVWPLVYVVFLATTLSWAGSKIGGRFWPRVNLLPIAAGVFDYLENVSTVVVMSRYPERSPVVEWLAPLFTVSKWTLLSASFVLLAVGLVVAAWVMVSARRQEQRQRR